MADSPINAQPKEGRNKEKKEEINKERLGSRCMESEILKKGKMN